MDDDTSPSMNWRERAQALHERTFGEKATIDFAKFGLAQQRQLAQQSEMLERSALARAKFEGQIQRNLSPGFDSKML